MNLFLMGPSPSPSPTTSTAVPAVAGHAFFDGFTWTNGTTLLAAALAALIAASVTVYGYTRNQRAARRDERAKGYAEALRAVEEYLEAPYRIRRREGSSEARQKVTDHISDVQSRISYYANWLRVHAPLTVADAYDEYVAAARREAGPQMTDAWNQPAIKHDRQVPLGTGYAQPQSRQAGTVAVAAMRRDLGVRTRRTERVKHPTK